jgi:hypothetical protein
VAVGQTAKAIIIGGRSRAGSIVIRKRAVLKALMWKRHKAWLARMKGGERGVR